MFRSHSAPHCLPRPRFRWKCASRLLRVSFQCMYSVIYILYKWLESFCHFLVHHGRLCRLYHWPQRQGYYKSKLPRRCANDKGDREVCQLLDRSGGRGEETSLFRGQQRRRFDGGRCWLHRTRRWNLCLRIGEYWTYVTKTKICVTTRHSKSLSFSLFTA